MTLRSFIADTSGAITVDWTVLSAAACGLAIATAGALTDTYSSVTGNMDTELRSRNLSDAYREYAEIHFQNILETGVITSEEAEASYDAAEQNMNHDIISALEDGIAEMEAGTLTLEGLVDLVGVASVADQRNIVDEAVLDYYFGFYGSTPYYMTTASAPAATNT